MAFFPVLINFCLYNGHSGLFRGKRGFGSKRLIVMSDLASPFGDDQLETVIDVIQKFNVEINFMLVGLHLPTCLHCWPCFICCFCVCMSVLCREQLCVSWFMSTFLHC